MLSAVAAFYLLGFVGIPAFVMSKIISSEGMSNVLYFVWMAVFVVAVLSFGYSVYESVSGAYTQALGARLDVLKNL
jgi:purine-cytosine permease-like protein